MGYSDIERGQCKQNYIERTDKKKNADDLIKCEYRAIIAADRRILMSKVASATWISCALLSLGDPLFSLIAIFSIASHRRVLDAPLSNFNDPNLHIQDDSSGIKLTINKGKGTRRHLGEQVFLPGMKLRVEKRTGTRRKERERERTR